jgi:uncharacterized membrane protein
MFNQVNGLPVHPLVVHAVVVLLPAAVLGTIAIAVRPAWRQRYGTLVLWVTAVATALIPVATSSGESLEHRVGDPGRHAALGDQLIWFALPLLVLVGALVLLGRRADRASDDDAAAPRGAGLGRAVTVLAVVAALATGVQVYRVGDSGARAAWGDTGQSAARR